MPSAPFRPSQSAIMLAMVSAAFAGEASAAAGRAEFTIGGVTVSRDGVERPLARGTELDNGDVVRTNNGRAQIRFTDGAYVSLQPNTEFGIREYRYENRTDGSERGLFGLLKGAMRTVTGAIGRINRDRYQVATPTATVGIRGTGGVIQVQDDGSTLVIGTSGIWSLTNPSGSVDVPAGTSAVAPSDPAQPPQETTQQPTSGPAPVQEEQPQFVQGEQVDEQGLPIIPEPAFTPLLTGPGYAAVMAYGEDIGDFIFIPHLDPVSNGNGVFNSAGQLTELTASTFRLEGGGSHAEFGTDGILAWGRWIGPVTADVAGVQSYDANQGLHYVVGLPTPVMPTIGSARYTLLGATQPTYTDGTASPGTFSGELAVNFGLRAGMSLTFNVGIDGKSYVMTGNTITNTLFTMSTLNQNLLVSGCSSSCSGLVNGFFSGATAERAGAGYHISDSFTGKEIIGAAAFQKGAPLPPLLLQGPALIQGGL